MARGDRPQHVEPVCGICDGFGRKRVWASQRNGQKVCLIKHTIVGQFDKPCAQFRSSFHMIHCPKEGLKSMEYCALDKTASLCPHPCDMPEIAACYLFEHPHRRQDFPTTEEIKAKRKKIW